MKGGGGPAAASGASRSDQPRRPSSAQSAAGTTAGQQVSSQLSDHLYFAVRPADHSSSGSYTHRLQGSSESNGHRPRRPSSAQSAAVWPGSSQPSDRQYYASRLDGPQQAHGPATGPEKETEWESPSKRQRRRERHYRRRSRSLSSDARERPRAEEKSPRREERSIRREQERPRREDWREERQPGGGPREGALAYHTAGAGLTGYDRGETRTGHVTGSQE